jgi:hypothetical protein
MDIKKLTQTHMKHQVAGGATEVVMFPPNRTSQMLVSSESFSVIDLLSEGPLGGLVDQNGAWALADRALCGVYINQVPVRETLSNAAFTHRTFPQGCNTEQYKASEIAGILHILQEFDGNLRAVAHSSNTDRTPDIDRFLAANASRLNWKVMDLLQQSSEFDDIMLRGTTRYFGSDDIRYAFIPASEISIPDLNLSSNNASLRVMWSGTGGATGILGQRAVRNSNNEGEFNKMIVSEIPDPIINLAYGTQYSDNNLVRSLNGGYIMIPIAAGDVLSSSGFSPFFYDNHQIDNSANWTKYNGTQTFLDERSGYQCNPSTTLPMNLYYTGNNVTDSTLVRFSCEVYGDSSSSSDAYVRFMRCNDAGNSTSLLGDQFDITAGLWEKYSGQVNVSSQGSNDNLGFHIENDAGTTYIRNIKFEVDTTGSGVQFSSVDTGCLDPTSAQLNGATLFLQSTREDLTNTYNYDKIDVEMRLGTEDQAPLNSVSITSRSYDTPFDLKGPITQSSYSDRYDPLKMQRLSPSNAANAYQTSSNYLSEKEDFASWARGSFGNMIDERATYTHIIENPAVSTVSATFTLSALYDTVVTDDPDVEGSKAGTPTVALMEVGIELGLEGDEDPSDPLYTTLRQYHRDITFGLEGMVRGSPFRFRVGGGSQNSSSWIAGTRGTRYSDLRDLPLPPEVQGRKRYIRVYRLTPETFSSKRSLAIALIAINEYYGKSFAYPLSALAGVTVDSRAFARVPSRSYDVRLKKVLIPSNYYPLENDGRDKRFIDNKNTYSTGTAPQVYEGSWDGTFRYAWTDNPAWIIYDMLVDPVYAIGNQIDDLRDINIWQLYEIGRFCDAVNDSGQFVGVDDGNGGLEPRFSCNIMINNEQDAYNIINSIATVFRGTCFYAGSDIDFYYDHEEEEIAFFNNSNVSEGQFNYSDSLKSSRYTVVEVPYIDAKDNYLQKIEYYEDEEAIQRYGYIKKTFQGIGITSRGQAQRFAKYALLSNKLETENVTFVAGREAMMIQPSDIIRIDDELKTLEGVGTYVADIDTSANRLIIPWQATGEFDTGVYLYCVTGENALDTLFSQAYDSGTAVTQAQIDGMNNRRIQYFPVTGWGTTGADGGGTGVVVHLDGGYSGIGRLAGVPTGSFCSIKTTGRNDRLYKVVSTEELSENKTEVKAIQYEPRKYGLIESGIRFSTTETYFENLAVDYNSNTPAKPSGVGVSGGATIVSGVGGIYVTGTITEPQTLPAAAQYEAIMTTPRGKKYTKMLENTGTNTRAVWGPFNEFGTYNLSAWSYGAAPLDLRSTLPATGNASITNLSQAAYDHIALETVTIENSEGAFQRSNVSQFATGNYITNEVGLRISWTLRDRMGKTLSTAYDIEKHWDNPRVNIDFRNGSNVMRATGILTDLKSNSAFIPRTLLEGIDPDTLRLYYIDLRVTGDSQTGQTTGRLSIQNPAPLPTRVTALGAYDGISNGVDIYMNMPTRDRETLKSVLIYTGASGEFELQTDDTNLFIEKKLDDGEGIMKKAVNVLSSDYYPEILNDSMFAAEAPNDVLFVQGETVKMSNIGGGESLPDTLSEDTHYELILGKTFGALFYLDGEPGYWESDSASGFPSWAYVDNTGAADKLAPYQPLPVLTNCTSETTGGTGLCSGTNGTYPLLTPSEKGLWLYASGTRDYTVDIGTGWVYVTGKVTGSPWKDVNGTNNITVPADSNGVWAFVSTAAWNSSGQWAFVADANYNFPSLNEIATINFDSQRNIRLAEDRDATNDAHAFCQQLTPSMTMAGWVKPYNTLEDQFIFDCASTGGGWSVMLSGRETAGDTSGTYWVNMRLGHTGGNSTGGFISFTGDANTWEVAKWFHMAVTFYTESGAAGYTGHAACYINGILSASGSASGSGIAEHYGACGMARQFGQSSSGVGFNKTAPATWSDTQFRGAMADIGVFAGSWTEREVLEDYYRLRNQYTFKLSTGNFMIQSVTGDNVDEFQSIRSVENDIVHLELGVSAGAADNQNNLVQAIRSATNMTGIAKSFTVQSNVAVTTNNAYTDLINTTFYLSEVDFLSQNYLWQNIQKNNIYMRYISGGATNGAHGRWIMYSGDTGKILYEYSGVNTGNEGLINTSSTGAATGKVPVGAYMSIASSGTQVGLPSTPLPLISSKSQVDGQTVSYTDIYMRVWLVDYVGRSWWSYPENRNDGVKMNLALTSDLSARTQAKGNVAVGEQLQYLIDTMRIGAEAEATSSASDFTDWVNNYLGGNFQAISESPIAQEGEESSTSQTTAPQFQSSANFTVYWNLEGTYPGEPYEFTVKASHPDPSATLYIALDSEYLVTNDPATNATGMTYSAVTDRWTRTITGEDQQTIWITAKSAGLALSNPISQVINIAYEYYWDGESQL